MPNIVPLQEPFSFSKGWIVLSAISLLIMVGYFVYRKTVSMIKNRKPKPPTGNQVEKVKRKYIEKLTRVEEEVKQNSLSSRKAYQTVSMLIRQFVYELTGIKVQNCTLEEIKKMEMPVLTELVKEYYEPEFSENQEGNIQQSIQKTRMVIEKWN